MIAFIDFGLQINLLNYFYKQKLIEAGKKNKKLSPYEKLRQEVVDFYDKVFRFVYMYIVAKYCK